MQAVADAATGSGSDEALHAQVEQLLHDDRERRRAHAARLDADGLALVRARVAQQRAVLGDQPGARRGRRRTARRSSSPGRDRRAAARVERSRRSRRGDGSVAWPRVYRPALGGRWHAQRQAPQRVPGLLRRVPDEPCLARHVADRQKRRQRVLGRGEVVIGHVLGDGQMRHDLLVRARVGRVTRGMRRPERASGAGRARPAGARDRRRSDQRPTAPSVNGKAISAAMICSIERRTSSFSPIGAMNG